MIDASKEDVWVSVETTTTNKSSVRRGRVESEGKVTMTTTGEGSKDDVCPCGLG